MSTFDRIISPTAIAVAILYGGMTGCSSSTTPSKPDAKSVSSAEPTPVVETAAPTTSTDEPQSTPSPEPEPEPQTTPEPSEPALAEKNTTDGVWKVKSARIGGQPLPPQVTDTFTLTMTGDDYLVMVGDKPDKGTCTINRELTPIQMTIKGTEGPNAGNTLRAICDFPDESTMRVCYDLSGKAFPETFESTAENKQYLVVYVRK